MRYFQFAASLVLMVHMSAHAAQSCAKPPRASAVFNVVDSGARGNGEADDTAAIQSAIDTMARTGGTVLVPDGTYMINALVGISIRDDMTLRLSDGATLKAIPNASDRYNIVKIEKVSNANLIGGILEGERDAHMGKSGEWGMGVFINAASNIAIEGTIARNAWGDGFYVRGASTNIRFCKVVADNNRRQGMSIISVNGLLVQDSIFSNTNGAAPQAGIDIEPNENDAVNNVRIQGSRFVDNKGFGVQIYVAPYSSANRSIRNVSVEGNTITGNQRGGISIAYSDDHKIIGNTLEDNMRVGIHFAKGTKGNSAINNILGKGNPLVDLGKNNSRNNRFR